MSAQEVEAVEELAHRRWRGRLTRRVALGGRVAGRVRGGAGRELEVAQGGRKLVTRDLTAQNPRMAEIRPVLGHSGGSASTQGKTVGG